MPLVHNFAKSFIIEKQKVFPQFWRKKKVFIQTYNTLFCKYVLQIYLEGKII